MHARMKGTFGIMNMQNTDMICKAMEGFDWNNSFLNKDVNEKATILTKTVLNIMSNYN